MFISAFRLTVPSAPAPARTASPTAPGAIWKELETTEIPAGWGFKSVESSQGSLNYQGPSRVRLKLETAGIELIGLRHGESEANAAANQGSPVMTGQSESPLSAKGKQQAAQAAQKLFERFGGDAWIEQAAQDPEKLPVILSSTLSRAHDTALAFAHLVEERSQALGCPLELPVVSDRRLMEIGFGEYEGKPGSKFLREHPKFARDWDGHRGLGVDYQHRFPGGESRLDVMKRVTAVLEEVAEKAAGRRVLLVCHQETLVGVKTALGLSRVRDGRIRADSGEIENATPISLIPARCL